MTHPLADQIWPDGSFHLDRKKIHMTSPKEYRQFRTENCHHSEDVAKICQTFLPLKKI
jgi:hypothetical protein